jgi:hypothetical protein
MRLIRMFVVAAAVCLGGLAALAGPAMAEPPYEPNDSILDAAGPLAANQTYTAGLETENDVDFYYFYVTGPTSSQVTITLTSLGGSSSGADFRGYLDDSEGNVITGLGELSGGTAGKYGTESITLEPGKYFIQVNSRGATGASYKFVGTGTTGAFGSYATIAAQCQAALTPVGQYQAQLAAAETNLKKAATKEKKYGESRNRKVRNKVRKKYAHVKEVVTAEKQSLKAAENAESPWCFIPQ